jgi:hypothetical protein
LSEGIASEHLPKLMDAMAQPAVLVDIQNAMDVAAAAAAV